MSRAVACSAEAEMQKLVQEHQDLKREVDAYHRRAILTPSEQRHVQVLKKRKLAAKDAMRGLRRA